MRRIIRRGSAAALLAVAWAGSAQAAGTASNPYSWDPANVAITAGSINGVSMGQTTPIPHIDVGASTSHTTLAAGGSGIFGQPYYYGTSSSSTDALNYLGISDSVNYTGANFESGFGLYDSLGSGAGGNHNAITGSVGINHTGISTPGSYVGVFGTGQATVNVGGTAGSISPASYAGAVWGGNFYPILNSGATNWLGVYGIESDTVMSSGSSAATQVNLLLDQRPNSTVQGVYNDDGLAIAGTASSAGYQNQISFGMPTSDPATSSTGTLIVAQPRRYAWSGTLPTISYGAGIDLRLGSATSAQIETPGFEADPSGNLFASRLTTTGTLAAQTATVASMTVTSGGAYTTIPTLYVQAPPAGGTTATATVATMGLSSFAPVLSVASAGAGCASGDTYSITGGGGAQLTGTASGGTVTSAAFAAAGSVTSLPSNPVSVTGGSCTTEPTFNVAWQILTVNTTGGSGYPAAPLPVVDTSATSYKEATIVPTMAVSAATLALNPGGAVSIGGGTVSGADTSAAVATATGGSTSRSLAGHLGDTLNVLDYGVSNAGYYNPHAYVSVASGTPTVLTVGGANFTAANVGNLLFVGGIGASGAELATTITAVNSSTQVVMATAASTFVSGSAQSVAFGVDQATAINNFFAATMNNSSSGVNNFYQAKRVVFPLGVYIVKSAGLNFTNMTNKTVDFQGSTIYEATTGVAGIDALGLFSSNLRDFNIVGDQADQPTDGLQLGRYTTNGQAFGLNDLSDGTINGYFSITPLYNLASETTQFNHIQTREYQPNTYAAIFDGTNHFGLTSAYVTMNWSADYGQTFSLDTVRNSRFVDSASGSNGVFVSNAADHDWMGSNYVNTGGYGFVMWGSSSARITGWHFAGNIEGTTNPNSNGPTDDFYFDCATAGSAVGSSCATANQNTAATDISYDTDADLAASYTFAHNPTQNVRISRLDFVTDSIDESAASLFDANQTGAVWTPIGEIKFGNTTTIPSGGLPSGFCGVIWNAASSRTEYCLTATSPSLGGTVASTGVFNESGTTTNTPAAGTLSLLGSSAITSLGAAGEGAVALSGTYGIKYQGDGSSCDHAFYGPSGASDLCLGHVTSGAGPVIAYGDIYTEPGTAPTASAGTVDTATYMSTDNHFAVTGLSAATTITLTFAHTWPYKPYCTGGAAGGAPVIATTTTTTAQFTLSSLTGTFQGGCS